MTKEQATRVCEIRKQIAALGEQIDKLRAELETLVPPRSYNELIRLGSDGLDGPGD